MKRLVCLARLSAVACLAACSTAPLHYHTLLAPIEQAEAAVPPAPFLIDVLAVGIPARLDQPQLVVRDGASGVTLLEGERWAGPLDDEVRAALSATLTRRLATQDVAGLARQSDRQVMRIKLQLRRLDAWPGQRAQLDADWSLSMAHQAGSARLTCHGRFDTAAPGGYEALVQAQQRLLAALAERIAADARSWSPTRTAACSDTASAAVTRAGDPGLTVERPAAPR